MKSLNQNSVKAPQYIRYQVRSLERAARNILMDMANAVVYYTTGSNTTVSVPLESAEQINLDKSSWTVING